LRRNVVRDVLRSEIEAIISECVSALSSEEKFTPELLAGYSQRLEQILAKAWRADEVFESNGAKYQGKRMKKGEKALLGVLEIG
jgi:hypothetical protein